MEKHTHQMKWGTIKSDNPLPGLCGPGLEDETAKMLDFLISGNFCDAFECADYSGIAWKSAYQKTNDIYTIKDVIGCLVALCGNSCPTDGSISIVIQYVISCLVKEIESAGNSTDNR